jgi:hypothetical protein
MKGGLEDGAPISDKIEHASRWFMAIVEVSATIKYRFL